MGDSELPPSVSVQICDVQGSATVWEVLLAAEEAKKKAVAPSELVKTVRAYAHHLSTENSLRQRLKGYVDSTGLTAVLRKAAREPCMLLNDVGSCDALLSAVEANPMNFATGPNQLWSWDITKLLGPAKWTYFYLYVILDVYSRYTVGWMLAHRESAALAKRLIAETCERQARSRSGSCCGVGRVARPVRWRRSQAKRSRGEDRIDARRHLEARGPTGREGPGLRPRRRP